MKKDRFEVTGMTCSACSSRVDKSVRKIPGVEEVNVNLLTGSMDVTYDESTVNTGDITACVEKAGYGASLMGGEKKKQGSKSVSGNSEGNSLRKHNEEATLNMRKRLIWSIVFMAPLMYISMSMMDMIPAPEFLRAVLHGTENAVTLAVTELLLVLPIIYINRAFFIKGFSTLFHGAPNMDTLIAVGATASVAYGIFAIYRMSYGLGRGDMHLVMKFQMELYFESAGMIPTLITLGKYFETRSKGKTSEAVEKLMDLAPKEASVLRDDEEVLIPAEELVAGDMVLIRPGESVPADGTILEGQTTLDESAITGESVPVEKGPGDSVISASLNTTGFIKVKAEKVGEDSTIQQIIKVVEEASSSKAPIAKAADKVAGIFVPIVMAIAATVFVIWMIATRNFELSLSMSITILVISCPCAMGLATPVAIMVATGKGAQNGILIKSGEALEAAHSIDTVVLDKTGTITEGRPRVTDVIIMTGMTHDDLVRIAVSLEKGSSHPLAAAIVNYAEEKGIRPLEVDDFKTIHGKGVEARLLAKTYMAGNRMFLEDYGISDIPKEKMDSLASQGKTPILIAGDGRLLGIIGMADVAKATSKQAIDELKSMGINVVMLTGDNAVTAKTVCEGLGISDFIAEVLPQDKEKEIARLQAEGKKVAMVGDGINDAPALTRADFGMAIGAGTDIAIESADAVLIKNDLLDAVAALRLGEATMRNIKQNLFWAFFYNALCIPIAAGVLYPKFGIRLSPMIGSAAMGFSSVFVVGNALRLRAFKVLRKKEAEAETAEKADMAVKVTFVEQEAAVPAEERKEASKMNKEIFIEGMMCGHCVDHVTKALEGIEGVDAAEVSLDEKKASIKAADSVSDDMIKTAVSDAGYEVKEIKSL
ncbi:MAG: heavy metal translocating P-type ATPase [Clostridiales bacterium]|nr:heavy metal translocating P-type ATPase [Clostridiales bacterium]MBS5877392.1 heavy metal translocating P-type ATPase [Clostridiales bacterium]MDU3490293.1 heavy metal translocating P-type ATPase [Clostridiales bacterium]